MWKILLSLNNHVTIVIAIVCVTACDRGPGKVKFDRNSESAFHFPTSTTIFLPFVRRRDASVRKRNEILLVRLIVESAARDSWSFSPRRIVSIDRKNWGPRGISGDANARITPHTIRRSIRGRAQHYSRNVLSDS